MLLSLSQTRDAGQPPADNQAEVCLFGPSYGECVLVHLGGGAWICVDSCLDENKEPAALAYLARIGVDPALALKLVVATHWHDDHVRGLSKVVSAANAARFACAQALTEEEFYTLADSYNRTAMLESSGVDELCKILRLIKGRQQVVHYSGEATQLVRPGQDGSAAAVAAISPSGAEFQRAIASFVRMNTVRPNTPEPIGRVARPKENHVALALRFEWPRHIAFLGSDLEEHGDPARGWLRAIHVDVCAPGTASLFKIPHHGSETAFHAPMWASHLTAESVGILTPFRHGSVSLPKPNGIAWLLARSPQMFITTPKDGRKPPARARVVEDEIQAVTRGRFESVASRTGWIRARADLQGAQVGWNVELFGAAARLAA